MYLCKMSYPGDNQNNSLDQLEENQHNTLALLEENQHNTLAQLENNQPLADFLGRFIPRPLAEFFDDNWEFFLAVIIADLFLVILILIFVKDTDYRLFLLGTIAWYDFMLISILVIMFVIERCQ